MIRSALIYLDPDESPGLGSPDRAVAGLPWLVRWILTASRAGVENFVVVGEGSLEKAKSLLQERFSRAQIRVSWIHLSQAHVLTQTIQGLGSSDAFWMVSPWNSYIPKKAWRLIQEGSVPQPVTISDGKMPVATVVGQKDLIKEIPQRAEPPVSRELPGCRRVIARADVAYVESRLYSDLIKDTEGFMSRHIERKISFAITKLLIKTPLTPNVISVFNILLGIGSAFMLAIPDRRTQVSGALLFLLTSILDGCDGEVARLKFMESKWGGWLDFLGDNLVHVAVFWGIAVGVWMGDGDAWARTLGLFAVGGTICSSLFVFFKSRQAEAQGEPSGPFFTTVAHKSSSRLAQMDDFLTRRDFIYLVVALAAVGKLQWFLWMSAIGSPLFFVTLIIIHLKESFLGEKTI